MNKISFWRVFILSAIIVFIISILGISDYIRKIESYKPLPTIKISEGVFKYKLFLLEELQRQGFKFRDFLTLKEVIKCESNWKQFNQNGTLIISKGNRGLFQINTLAHKNTYKAMKLDITNPYDNIRFGIYLYKKNGLNDWRSWSGKCWERKIK